jgi:hypothetical protein
VSITILHFLFLGLNSHGVPAKQKSTHMRLPFWVVEKIKLHAQTFRRGDSGQVEQMLVVYDLVVKEFRHDNITAILEDIRRWKAAAEKKV